MKPKMECMMKHIGRYLAVMLCLALAMSLLAGFMPGVMSTAKAEGETTFNIAVSGNTFTVTRSGDTSKAQTIRYRTVSLSALDGKNFTGVSGVLTFAAGSQNANKSVSVSTLSPTGNDIIYKYQEGTSRSYRFELLDEGGFPLNKYADNNITYSGCSVTSSSFENKEITVFSTETNVTDAGYSQAYHDVPFSNTFTTALRTYLQKIGAELRMTVGFEMKEVEDGYQDIQILVNNTTGCDTGAGNKTPGNINVSKYMACFGHKPSSKYTTYASYSFPLTSAGNNCDEVENAWNYSPLNNTVGKLYTQKFNTDPTNCRASDGRLIIPTDLSTLGIRFNASGDNSDTWTVKNVKANIQAVDTAAPTVQTSNIKVSPGSHSKGNSAYISVPFSEIVAVTGTPTLATTWGTFSYVSGSKSNVLTFKCDSINATAGTALKIRSLSLTNAAIKDQSGKSFTGSVSKEFSTTKVAAGYGYPISYELNGGVLPEGAPVSYTYDSGATLLNPTRTGYTFTGWTGDNGSTPQTSVTIPAGQHGNKSYTANWTANTYTVRFDANAATEIGGTMTDISFTYDEAEVLPANAFTRIGCTFKEWNTEPDGTGTACADGASVSNLTDVDGGVVTLYAQWEYIEYTITKGEGAENLWLENETAYYGDTVIICEEYYWMIRSVSMNGTALTAADGRYSFTMPAGNVILTADMIPGGSWYDEAYSALVGYWKIENGTLTVSGTAGIPDTKIGEAAWYEFREDVTKVVIQNGITGIGNRAFYDFRSMEEVSIPASVTRIGDGAFSACISLGEVTIPSGVTSIGKNAFSSCISLGEISIPASVTRIGDNAFSSCTSLRSISIPDSVTAIGLDTFENCTQLETVQLPSGLTALPMGIFDRCSQLKNVTIPSGVTDINSGAFSGCSSLEEITLPSGLTNIYGSAFYGCTALKHITLPSGVKTIENWVFYNCSSLEEVSLPSGITAIYQGVFSGCSSLQEITIPSGVTAVGDNAFSGCTSLTTVGIPTGITEVGKDIFSQTPVSTVMFAGSRKQWESDKTMLGLDDESITVHCSLFNITVEGDHANHLSAVPDPVKKDTVISLTAENGWVIRSVSVNGTALNPVNGVWSFVMPEEDVTLTANLIPCGDWEGIHWEIENGTLTVSGTGNIPNTNGYNIFAPWYDFREEVTAVVIGNGITGIGNYAFFEFQKMTSVTIPNTVTRIGDGSFKFCDKLAGVTIPDGVTEIGNVAFYYCKDALTEIVIPDSVTSLGTSIFDGCSSLRSVTLPSGLTTIPGCMFAGCWNLTGITIPSGVVCIEEETFSGCASLKEITIPSGVEIIMYNAFAGCDSLEEITIPSSVNDLQAYAFSNCNSLKTVTLLCETTGIQSDVFSGSPIDTIWFGGTPTQWIYVEHDLKLEDDDITVYFGKYTITFVDEDGTEMQTVDTVAGELPVYPGGTPTKAADETSGFVFAGWLPDIGTATEDTTYTASYKRAYPITVDPTMEHGSIRVSDAYAAAGAIVSLEPFADDGYEFDSISARAADGTAISVTENELCEGVYQFTMPGQPVTVSAVFVLEQYTVTFVDEDGTVLKEATVYDYGTAAYDIVKPADPTKNADEQYTYTFAGWSPEIKSVTCNATYTATYTQAPRKYTITWEDNEGNVLDTTEAAYGATPTHADPEKEADEYYTYTFIGWDPEIEPATEDTTYCAMFDWEVRQYSITLMPCDHAIIDIYDADGIPIGGTVERDSRVCILVEPDPGYYLSGMIFTDENGDAITDSFAIDFDEETALPYYYGDMPCCSVTVTATVVPMPALSTGTTPINFYMLDMNHSVYCFTPDQTGYYSFRSEGEYEFLVQANFSDENGRVSATEYNENDNTQCVVCMKAGKAYTVRFFSFFGEGTCNIIVEKLESFAIQVDPNLSHGSIQVVEYEKEEEITDAPSGMLISVMAIPDSGYDLAGWQIKDGNASAIELILLQNNALFYMPDSAVTVSAVFRPNAFGDPTFILPAALTTIEESAFEGNPMMTIVDASHCTKIEANAFRGCTNLTQIKLPKDCEIDSAAFDHPVYVFAPDGGTTKDACDEQDNLIFAGEIVVK